MLEVVPPTTKNSLSGPSTVPDYPTSDGAKERTAIGFAPALLVLRGECGIVYVLGLRDSGCRVVKQRIAYGVYRDCISAMKGNT